jgi:hypothetical protein
MVAGTGQRRGDGAAPAPPCPRDAPAVVAHTPRQAGAALAAAGPRGVVLLSAPAAAGGMGAAWFLALVAQAREAVGNEVPTVSTPCWAMLDCGDAPGFALSALRAGARLLVLDPAVPAFSAVAAAAAAVGAAVWTARPPALDLGGLDLREGRRGNRRLAEWLTGRAVTGKPGLG